MHYIRKQGDLYSDHTQYSTFYQSYFIFIRPSRVTNSFLCRYHQFRRLYPYLEPYVYSSPHPRFGRPCATGYGLPFFFTLIYIILLLPLQVITFPKIQLLIIFTNFNAVLLLAQSRIGLPFPDFCRSEECFRSNQEQNTTVTSH